MSHDSILVKVSNSGRMSIPARQRKLLGVEDGGMVVLRMEDGELRIRSVKDVVAQLQALVRESSGPAEGSAVEWLLRERRREVAKEEAEYLEGEKTANERTRRERDHRPSEE